MSTPPTPYDHAIRSFAWDIPVKYNIGVDIADRWARTDRIALIVKTKDGEVREISFKELTLASNRLANALVAHGLGAGDRIGLLLPQCPQTAISHIAAYKIGAIAVPLASLFGVDALHYRLTDSGAKIVITDLAGAEKIAPIADRLPHLAMVIVVEGGGGTDFDKLLESGTDRFNAADTGPDDPAVMVYTSGTTGPPKGALHGHRVLLGHLPGPMTVFRRPVTSCGHRRTGPGPAGFSTFCCRPCISAYRWWCMIFANSTPRRPSI